MLNLSRGSGIEGAGNVDFVYFARPKFIISSGRGFLQDTWNRFKHKRSLSSKVAYVAQIEKKVHVKSVPNFVKEVKGTRLDFKASKSKTADHIAIIGSLNVKEQLLADNSTEVSKPQVQLTARSAELTAMHVVALHKSESLEVAA